MQVDNTFDIIMPKEIVLIITGSKHREEMVVMKHTYRSMMGVTLLEIMLVLAIAALVIVMSIRFYQSASDTNKVNAGMSTVQGIVAAGENAVAGGSAAGVSGNTMPADILNYLPNAEFPNGPWGGKATVTAGTATSYQIVMPAPGTDAASPCGKLKAYLLQNKKFTGTDCTGGNISVHVTM